MACVTLSEKLFGLVSDWRQKEAEGPTDGTTMFSELRL